jgi:hypothetical protein
VSVRDGSVLPPRLSATAEVFAQGRAGLRHVEVIARVLGGKSAGRLSPGQWAGVEAQLAAKAELYTPTELQNWGTALVELLDQDGAEPDDRPPAQLNELHLSRLPSGGGKLKGRFDDAAMFDAIATVIDAKAKPLTGDDDRSAGERQAEALAEVCGYVLDHGDVPECGGHRPHVNMLIRLDDLENRARAGCLDFGGPIAPELLRDAVLRRRHRPRRHERPGPAARRRPGHPHHPGRAPASRGGSRSRLCASGMRSTRLLVPLSPHSALGAGRRYQARQRGHALRGAPPADPFHGMDRADPQRIA